MDPASIKLLFDITYKSVTIAKALTEIYSNLNTFKKIETELGTVNKTLSGIEEILKTNIYQPLKSGLAMLEDAEAEYNVNKEKSKELARIALKEFNSAEGLLHTDEDILITATGKACLYKLLEMEGAYNKNALHANEILNNLKKIEEQKEIERKKELERQKEAEKREADNDSWSSDDDDRIYIPFDDTFGWH